MNKKLLQFASMLLMAVCLCVNFTACDDDDEDSTTGTTNGYAWVDLGLPSGLKWAICNVGAENPWEYGDYFAWGETAPKSVYDLSTYLDGRITEYRDCGTDNDLLNGITDIKGTKYDVVRANMGKKWRMPTFAECQELLRECDWVWTEDYNGISVKGYIVYKRKNENFYSSLYGVPSSPYSISDTHIFLPATGWLYGSSLDFAGSACYYWSSSLEDGSMDAYCIFAGWIDFYTNHYMKYQPREFGMTVRGVCE